MRDQSQSKHADMERHLGVSVSELNAIIEKIAARLGRSYPNIPMEQGDIANELWVRIIERYRNYDSSKGSVAGYLFTAARNMVIDEVRRNGIVRFRSAVPDVPTSDTRKIAEDNLEREDIEKTVRHCLPNKKQAECVCKRVLDGTPSAKLASDLEMSPSNVNSNVCRGLKRLSQVLPKVYPELFL